MWQKCWNQNASVFQGLRYRERGPMKSWRSETMAEAIWSVLQEGLSLSQAARKHDIPYPSKTSCVLGERETEFLILVSLASKVGRYWWGLRAIWGRGVRALSDICWSV